MRGMSKADRLDDRTEELAQQTIGAAIEVHRALGPGFLEAVYESAFIHELALRQVPCICQHRVPIEYKGVNIGEDRIDLMVDNRLIVELKSVSELAPVHEAQLISYLKATNLRLGLLINFNVVLLKNGLRRIIL